MIGTDKQIAWASSLKIKALIGLKRNLEEISHHPSAAPEVREALSIILDAFESRKEAEWWINTCRKFGYFWWNDSKMSLEARMEDLGEWATNNGLPEITESKHIIDAANLFAHHVRTSKKHIKDI